MAQRMTGRNGLTTLAGGLAALALAGCGGGNPVTGIGGDLPAPDGPGLVVVPSALAGELASESLLAPFVKASPLALTLSPAPCAST